MELYILFNSLLKIILYFLLYAGKNIKTVIKITAILLATLLFYFCYRLKIEFLFTLIISLLIFICNLLSGSSFVKLIKNSYLAVIIFSIYFYICFIITTKFSIESKLIVEIIFNCTYVVVSFLFLPLKLILMDYNILNCIYKCTIKIKDKLINATIYLDSGNFLYDKKTNLPIVLFSLSKLKLKYCNIDQIISSNDSTLINHFESKESIFCVMPESFKFKDCNGKWHTKKVVIGITEKNFGDFDGLMGLRCLE